MNRYRIDIAYDGTSYVGWQAQPDGGTVQQEIERAIHEMTAERTRVHGSGRTDQGVHARRQVAHFDLHKDVPCASLTKGLNAVLPADIRASKTRKTDSSFHARKGVRCKEYRYFIWNGDVVPPFRRKYVTHVRRKLNAEAMQEAACVLVGRHDFGAFTANPNRKVESTVRTLVELKIVQHGSEIMIRARGDGFLYKMVRSLAGCLIRVGEGALPAGKIGAILASRKRTARVPTAPPQGLFLWNVTY